MLYEIMKSINNFFIGETLDGTWTIEDDTIDLPFLVEGQYFMIEGSVLNDGVYKYPATDLKNETFKGKIHALKIPQAFIQLTKEIEEWQAKNGNSGPYTSESFGGYSYTRAEGSDGSWSGAFRARLRPWRKI